MCCMQNKWNQVDKLTKRSMITPSVALPLSVDAGATVCIKVEFREDLKLLFEKAAVGGKPVTFLFNDNQVCT